MTLRTVGERPVFDVGVDLLDDRVAAVGLQAWTRVRGLSLRRRGRGCLILGPRGRLRALVGVLGARSTQTAGFPVRTAVLRS